MKHSDRGPFRFRAYVYASLLCLYLGDLPSLSSGADRGPDTTWTQQRQKLFLPEPGRASSSTESVRVRLPVGIFLRGKSNSVSLSCRPHVLYPLSPSMQWDHGYERSENQSVVQGVNILAISRYPSCLFDDRHRLWDLLRHI